MEKQYFNSKELFQDTWKYATIKHKKRLLKERGLHESWANTTSPDEMVKRGGGMAVRDLGHLFDEYIKRNPGQKIKWR